LAQCLLAQCLLAQCLLAQPLLAQPHQGSSPGASPPQDGLLTQARAARLSTHAGYRCSWR
jgi:hypothetical protein